MMSKTKFSVVIPTCDRPLLLKKTLQSVFSQSFFPYEILIIDNGNKPVGKKVFNGNKRIRYIRALPRIGVAQARNTGICLAKGDYIAFLDDDDIWDKDYLKEMLDVINKTGATIVLGSVKILETGGVWWIRSEPIKSLEKFKYRLLRTNPGTMGSNTVVKRESIFKSSGFDPFLTTGEDRALVLDFILNGSLNIVRAEKAFVYYRTDTKGEKLSNDANFAKGKIRFLVKYWKIMDFPTRLKNLLGYLKLKNKKVAGIARTWGKITGKVRVIKDKMYRYLAMPYRMATAKRRALPDFLIIGITKGGTTSLNYFLSLHPQIHTAPQEVHYFDRDSNYKKGEPWYRSHFPFASAINPGDLVGEKTPDYLFFSKASKRIQKDLPNAKLICLLRNPTDRAISNYFMRLRQKHEHLPIMEAMTTDKLEWRPYKSRGLYLKQLQSYKSYLKNNRLLILSSEDFLADPQNTLKQVFRFLGVDETFKCPDFKYRNVGKNKNQVPREVYEYLNDYFKLPNRRLYKYLHRDFGW